jgi:hypothetical protein
MVFRRWTEGLAADSTVSNETGIDLTKQELSIVAQRLLRLA